MTGDGPRRMLAALSVCAAGLVGCSEEVPPAHFEGAGYTLWGNFDPNAPVQGESGWVVPIRLRLHDGELAQRMRTREIQYYRVTGIRIQGAVANDAWRPPDSFSFSRELLIHPGTVPNVTNGFGFVGAAYSFDEEWEYDELVIQSAGLYHRASGFEPEFHHRVPPSST